MGVDRDMETDVLIVDDEKELADAVKEYFDLFGIRCECRYDSRFYLTDWQAKVLLLDINLGGMSGYEILTKIRLQKPDQRVILISARQSEYDLLKGYGLGADDYIVKPFSLNVLLLKIKNLLARDEDSLRRESYRDLTVDGKAMKVERDGAEIPLKNMEFKLFYYLFTHRNQVIDKEEIIRSVWGDGYTSDNTLNVHIKRIREKLERSPQEYIVTVWGVGYKLI